MHDVAVIGGGIGGSIAALVHAQRGFDVVLIEKDTGPSHKLCGEFLSGEVAGKFAELGILESVREAGGVPLRQAKVTSMRGVATTSPLPGSPLGISRYTLDALLRDAAVAAGVELMHGRVDQVTRQGATFSVRWEGGAVESRLVIGAYGRRSVLDRKLQRPFMRRTYPYLAFKVHARGPDVDDRVELFSFDGGYCGLSPIENRRVNICWITHVDRFHDAGKDPLAMIQKCIANNRGFRDIAATMEVIDGTLCSSSQLFFQEKGASAGGVVFVGDAAGMIAPLCGDGMAMAVDAAIGVSSLSATYLAGGITMNEMAGRYERLRRSQYTLRMRLGRLLHRGLVSQHIANPGIQILSLLPTLTKRLVRYTRG